MKMKASCKGVALFLFFLGGVGLTQFLGTVINTSLGTKRFVSTLNGVSSEEYCPEYAERIRDVFEPYHPKEGGREGGTNDHNMKDQVDAYLREKQVMPVKLRRGSVQFLGKSIQDQKRLADFKSNVLLAQAMFGRLPDVDVWLVSGDAPGLPKDAAFLHQSSEGGGGEGGDDYGFLPPIGYTTTAAHHDISIPYLKLQIWNEEDQITALENSVHAHPWEHKINKAVWRGSTTGQPEPDETNLWTLPRALLVNMSLHNPDLLDARFTSCKQCHGRTADMYRQAGYGWAGFLSYEDQFKYRMLIDVDGNTWSSRFAQLLSINSVIFKQETEYVEWYRPLLQPYEHYVPVKKDLSDLIELMREMSVNKAQDLHHMAAASTRLYLQLLIPSKQLCYLHLLLREYILPPD